MLGNSWTIAFYGLYPVNLVGRGDYPLSPGKTSEDGLILIRRNSYNNPNGIYVKV